MIVSQNNVMNLNDVKVNLSLDNIIKEFVFAHVDPEN